MKEIQLTQGKVALVDDEDFERVNLFKWHALKKDNNYYASRHIPIGKTRKTTFIHQLVMNVDILSKEDIEIDHIDGNGLNNQKYNLRACTHSQNLMNSKKRINSSSKYKGVGWHKLRKKYRARIRLNGIQYHLGLFDSDIDAAKAYDNKAKELFGEFAKLNF